MLFNLLFTVLAVLLNSIFFDNTWAEHFMIGLVTFVIMSIISLHGMLLGLAKDVELLKMRQLMNGVDGEAQ